jgi:hypothetical protein
VFPSLGDIEIPHVYLDAIYVKACATDLPQVVCCAVVIATGITANGDRQVLGRAVGESEEEALWTEFRRSLKRCLDRRRRRTAPRHARRPVPGSVSLHGHRPPRRTQRYPPSTDGSSGAHRLSESNSSSTSSAGSTRPALSAASTRFRSSSCRTTGCHTRVLPSEPLFQLVVLGCVPYFYWQLRRS